jgi:hypothetical protein
MHHHLHADDLETRGMEAVAVANCATTQAQPVVRPPVFDNPKRAKLYGVLIEELPVREHLKRYFRQVGFKSAGNVLDSERFILKYFPQSDKAELKTLFRQLRVTGNCR